jgi:hypothetical protein
MRRLVLICVFALLASPCPARVITVDDDGPADYDNIQGAINVARDGDIVEVQPGMYTGPGNRDIDFLGRAITVRSTDPNDINTVAATIIDCNGSRDEPHRAFHFHRGEDSNSVIYGVTITGGFAPWHEYCPGGGQCWEVGDPGAGIYCEDAGPTIKNCIISANKTLGSGGGIFGCGGPIINCKITDNETMGFLCNGGGVCECSGPIINCRISGNSATGNGGGVSECSGGVFNCIITGNFAGWAGGGIGNAYVNSSNVISCVICYNLAHSFGGGGVAAGLEANFVIINSIVWGNEAASGTGPQIGFDWDSAVWVDYSDVQGGESDVYAEPGSTLHWGYGNIDADPCFLEPGYRVDANDPNVLVEPNDPNAVWVDGDYHLRSEGWYWNTDANQWDWDELTSRCIDAGNPGSPLGDEALTLDVDPLNRFGQNLRINMGAYGGTAEASMPPHHWALLADLNNDGTVNLVDVGHYVQYWLDAGSELPADLDRNGIVDLTDYALLGQDCFLQTSWHQ